MVNLLITDSALSKKEYSKIPILRPPFGLPKRGLISEVVLIYNTISSGKYHLGLAKTGLNSEVVLISSGLNSDILLYIYFLFHGWKNFNLVIRVMLKAIQCMFFGFVFFLPLQSTKGN